MPDPKIPEADNEVDNELPEIELDENPGMPYCPVCQQPLTASSPLTTLNKAKLAELLDAAMKEFGGSVEQRDRMFKR